MAAIATDGKGNYLTLNASGDWVPTSAPTQPKGWIATTQPTNEPTGGSEDIGLPVQSSPAPGGPPERVIDPIRPGPRTLDAPTFDFHPFAPPAPGALRRVGAAAEEGWRGGQMTDPGRFMAPLNNVLTGTAGAVFRGGQQFIKESLDPVSPGLGRDVAAMPEAFPFGVRNGLLPPEPPPPPYAQPSMADRLEGAVVRAGPSSAPTAEQQAFTRPAAPPAPPAGPPSGVWVPMQPGERYPGMETRINRDTGKPEVFDPTRGAAPEIPPPQPQPSPQPAPAVPPAEAAPPQPASVGAAASREGTPASAIVLTPEQAAAAGSTADKQWFYKTVTPGEVNDIQYLKGINPTTAQREQTVNAARDSATLRRLSPEADQNERALLSEHSDIRKGEFQDTAGSDVTQQADLKAANDRIEKELQAAYANGGTVDLQPVIDAANTELSGSAGKLPPLKAAMKEVTDAAQKSDGSGLETDPRQANAVRRAIIYMQSKEGRTANPGYGDRDVMAALTRVKDVLTKQIEPAAPGFTEANANYAKARQAIDAKEALQEYEPKLYDNFGHMRFAPFHRMMGDVVAARDPRAPFSGYSSLTEEQMARLKSIHDDLQRVASAEELAKAAGGGSITSQSLADMARRAVKGGVSTLGGGLAGLAVAHVWPSAAPTAAMFTKTALDNLFSQRAVAQATVEHNRLLRPDVTQYPLKPNPLMPPP